METLKIVYSGRVQGVGFRIRTQRAAAALSVQGWVRNLEDGRVEVCAQADKSILDDFLQVQESDFQGYITDRVIEPVTTKTIFENFEIRY